MLLFAKGLFILLFTNFLVPCSVAWTAGPDEVEVTILHTNDLHSQFREKTYPFPRGGVARLKTAIEKIRATEKHTALVDAGDWSEGTIYYTLGTGVESIRMMDHLGYDFAVVGNHDWLNGPDQLLDGMRVAQPRTQFLSFNLAIPESYARKSEFEEAILPYQIREYEGHRIAWIGISTYEFVYDKYFSPIKITQPVTAAAQLARRLKSEEKVDGVIVLSHNSIEFNQLILKAANELASQNQIDLVIGAHDHKKLIRPVEVSRLMGGPAAWIVETGWGGNFLGQVKVKLSQGHLELLNYQLIQMDSNIAQDSETLERVRQLDAQVEAKYGPVFHDEIGRSEIDFEGSGVENLMGDFVSDCYRREANAHLAIESSRFIYNAFNPGVIRSSDVFDAVPPIYRPTTDRTWTLKTLPMRGSVLKWLMSFLFSSKKLSSYGLVSLSGIRFKYDPLFAARHAFSEFGPHNLALDFENPDGQRFVGIESIPVIKDFEIMSSESSFLPLEDSRVYDVATGGGLIEAIEFMNSKLWSVISLEGLKDSGKENWRALADQIRERPNLNSDTVTIGNRIRTLRANLGLYPTDVRWKVREAEPAVWVAEIRARVTNYGSHSSVEGPEVKLLMNQNLSNLAIEPDYLEDPVSHRLGIIAPGEFQEVGWQISLPHVDHPIPVTLRIVGAETEVNTTNHEITVWVAKNRDEHS